MLHGREGRLGPGTNQGYALGATKLEGQKGLDTGGHKYGGQEGSGQLVFGGD